MGDIAGRVYDRYDLRREYSRHMTAGPGRLADRVCSARLLGIEENTDGHYYLQSCDYALFQGGKYKFYETEVFFLIHVRLIDKSLFMCMVTVYGGTGIIF